MLNDSPTTHTATVEMSQSSSNSNVISEAPVHNQATPLRSPIMEGFFSALFGNKPIKGMEIGVWYRKGSTKIWL